MPSQIPIMCCTCKKWHPFKDDLAEGMCKITYEGTRFDYECKSWKECEHEDQYCASILGYD